MIERCAEDERPKTKQLFRLVDSLDLADKTTTLDVHGLCCTFRSRSKSGSRPAAL